MIGKRNNLLRLGLFLLLIMLSLVGCSLRSNQSPSVTPENQEVPVGNEITVDRADSPIDNNVTEPDLPLVNVSTG